MKRFFLSCLLILSCYGFSPAQTTASKCPSISIEGPSAVPNPGEKIPFKVIISKDSDASKLKYEWSVSNGRILSGQGKKSIFAYQDNSDLTLTATINVKGLPQNCAGTASESVPVCGCVRPMLIDEYEKIEALEENKHLNKLANELLNNPSATAFIQKSFPRDSSKVNIYQKLQQILNHLKSQNIDTNLITFGVTYDKESEQTRLFIIPAGAAYPELNGEILDAAKIIKRLKTGKLKKRSFLRQH